MVCSFLLLLLGFTVIDSSFLQVIRNFLFGEPSNTRGNGIDLAARNMQRGRDHGLPFYNDMREYLGLARANSFNDITSNATLAALFAQVYNNSIDIVDTYVGGLAEGSCFVLLLSFIVLTVHY